MAATHNDGTIPYGTRTESISSTTYVLEEIEITRPGIPTHELQTPTGTPHPLMAAGKVIEAFGRALP